MNEEHRAQELRTGRPRAPWMRTIVTAILGLIISLALLRPLGVFAFVVFAVAGIVALANHFWGRQINAWAGRTADAWMKGREGKT